MSKMKQFLMEQIAELASKINIEESLVYRDTRLYELATAYAQLKLMLRREAL